MDLVQPNSGARIAAFLDLITDQTPIRSFWGSTVVPQTVFTPKQFLIDISPKSSTISMNGYKHDYLAHLKPFPVTELLYDKTTPLGEGTSATIYATLDDKYVLKFVKIGPAPVAGRLQRDYTQKIRGVIKEAFIQYYLQTDPDSYNSSFIPKIHGIYIFDRKEGIVVIQMDKVKNNIDTLWRNYVRRSFTKLKFAFISKFLEDIIHILTNLYNTYRFSHRDLKLNNIMTNEDLPYVQLKLIDFGLSALTVNLNGTEYRILNDLIYNYDVACSPKQDLGLLFSYMYDRYYTTRLLDSKCIKLFNILFTGNKNTPINNTAKSNSGTFIHKLAERYTPNISRPLGSSFWWSAYNIRGNLYTNDCPLTDTFSLENVSRVLREIETSAGGARTRGRKIHKRRSVRRSNN